MKQVQEINQDMEFMNAEVKHIVTQKTAIEENCRQLESKIDLAL